MNSTKDDAMHDARKPEPVLYSHPSAVILCLIAPAILLLGASARPLQKPLLTSPQQEFAGAVQPFLRTYCVKCHGPDKQLAKLRLDTLPNSFGDPAIKSKWAAVVNAINGHQMPPPAEKQPPIDVAGRFTDWIARELGRAKVAKRSTHEH